MEISLGIGKTSKRNWGKSQKHKRSYIAKKLRQVGSREREQENEKGDLLGETGE